MGDFNLALAIVTIVVFILVFIFNLYLLINYQHPDDVNQAYFRGRSGTLLCRYLHSHAPLPADVANRQACRRSIYNGACDLTLPMKDLWLAVYIVDAILVSSSFYYEVDQDKSVFKRMKSALLWVIVQAVVGALVLGIFTGLRERWTLLSGISPQQPDPSHLLHLHRTSQWSTVYWWRSETASASSETMRTTGCSCYNCWIKCS